MKQNGREIVGDTVKVDNYTSDWQQVRIHPLVFYRRYDTFVEGFKSTKGLYAMIDLGEFISVRFSNKNDMTTFHKLHHEYV